MDSPETPEKPAVLHPLDGVRPRHTVCPYCGYRPSGAAITHGVITCPECGGTVPFEPARPKVSKRVRVASRVITLAGALGIVGFGAVLWSATGAKAAVLFWGCVLLVAAAGAVLRAFLARD